jgi:hypothetical protein
MTVKTITKIVVEITEQDSATLFNSVYFIPLRSHASHDDAIQRHGQEFQIQLQNLIDRAVNLALAEHNKTIQP